MTSLRPSPSPKSKAKIPKCQSLKTDGPPPHPKTFKTSEKHLRSKPQVPLSVRTQEGVSSSGGEKEKDHRVVHHDQGTSLIKDTPKKW